VAVGYGVGAGLIFIPCFLLMGLLMSAVPGVVDQSGHILSGGARVLPMVIVVPFVVAMQGVMFGAW
jgi:hypothetical protein